MHNPDRGVLPRQLGRAGIKRVYQQGQMLLAISEAIYPTNCQETGPNGIYYSRSSKYDNGQCASRDRGR
jgi:hypothetical protein